MAKKGKTPSLIGGSLGSCHEATALRRRTCKRCGGSVPKGTTCMEVRVPGQLGNGKTFCLDCFGEILDQSQADLARLQDQLARARMES